MDQNAVNRARYRANYFRIMREAKELLGGKCTKCGSTDRLEFDHIDRSTKKFNISARAANGMKAIADELTKCQLLCRPCHLKKSGTELAERFSNEHGGGLHGIKRCKCTLCHERRLQTQNERRREKRGGLDRKPTVFKLDHRNQKNNASTGIRGVSKTPGERTYKVQVGYKGKRRYVGRFATLAEAESAAIKAREELHAPGSESGPDTMAA